MFGRRPEGKRVKHLDPIVQITPYLIGLYPVKQTMK